MDEFILRTAALVVAVGGALGVLWKGVKDMWAVARRVARILELVEHELQPNGGMSLKDRVIQNARALEELRENQEANRSEVNVNEWRRAEHDHLVDEVLRSMLDRLRALDGGTGADQFDPPEGTPV